MNGTVSKTFLVIILMFSLCLACGGAYFIWYASSSSACNFSKLIGLIVLALMLLSFCVYGLLYVKKKWHAPPFPYLEDSENSYKIIPDNSGDKLEITGNSLEEAMRESSLTLGLSCFCTLTTIAFIYGEKTHWWDWPFAVIAIIIFGGLSILLATSTFFIIYNYIKHGEARLQMKCPPFTPSEILTVEIQFTKSQYFDKNDRFYITCTQTYATHTGKDRHEIEKEQYSTIIQNGFPKTDSPPIQLAFSITIPENMTDSQNNHDDKYTWTLFHKNHMTNATRFEFILPMLIKHTEQTTPPCSLTHNYPSLK